MSGLGTRGTAAEAGVSDSGTPDLVIATVLEKHGHIDTLVNNAGGLHVRTSFWTPQTSSGSSRSAWTSTPPAG